MGADSRHRYLDDGGEMSKGKRKPKATEPSALDEARSRDAAPEIVDLPPVQGDPRDEPGNAKSRRKGQAGHAGSGKDAELQSVRRSQSDRAAGKSS